MNAPPRASKWAQWTSPTVVIAIVGYISLGVGAWMSFDGRLARNENEIEEIQRWVIETRAEVRKTGDENRSDLRRMDDKLDRLIERTGR